MLRTMNLFAKVPSSREVASSPKQILSIRLSNNIYLMYNYFLRFVPTTGERKKKQFKIPLIVGQYKAQHIFVTNVS